MKQQSKYNVIVTVILMCFASLSANAYDLYVDGLYYNILSKEDRTVEVTYYTIYFNYNMDYVKGNLEIPEKIMYNSTTYTVTAIGEKAFNGCQNLTSITIPNSVTSIGYMAFFDCSGLTSVKIPNSVACIGYDAFHCCSGLTEINVDAKNPSYVSEAGILYSKDKTTLIKCPVGKKGEIVMPNSVIKISNKAFYECSDLTSVTIPNSVIEIGDNSFYGCSDLTSVTIPNSVIEIGDNSFYGCSGLQNVTIGNSVISIGDYAFSECSGLQNVEIPNSVTAIGEWTFRGCSGLTNVTIGNSVTSIALATFFGCNALANITIPNSVTSIGPGAFYECSTLANVEIPNSVTTIDSLAFFDCPALTSIEIPNSVTTIGDDVFKGCSGLKSVYCHWTEPIKCSPSFPEEVVRYAVLYVPKGYMRLYEKVDPWRDFWNIEELKYAGVDTVAGDGVEVKVVDGAVVAYGCDEMEVYSMNGQLVYRGAGRADNLAPGIYAVRAGGKTVKVMVGR